MLALLPRDHAGGVDWVAALRGGVIRPRAVAPGRDSSRVTRFDYDLYLHRSPQSLESAFPHSRHTDWMTCASCHPTLYRTRDSDTASMAVINQGASCGVCHRTVAFPASTCERCHEDLPMKPGRVTPTLRDDAVIARPTDSSAAAARRAYPPASFSHAFHRIRYRCSACHIELYAMRAGAGSMRMAEMERGGGCGACHDGTVAFGMVRCERCHAGVVTGRGS